jgi:hypothetical protein
VVVIVPQRKLYIEVCNLYSSSHGSSVIKLQVGWEKQVACIREREMHTRFLSEILKDGGHVRKRHEW